MLIDAGLLGSIFMALCAVCIIVKILRISQIMTLIFYGYSFLQHCTKNSSEKLGQGTFGSVFKGLLPGSKLVHVQKLQGMKQGEKQFQTEVRTLGKVHHN